LNNTIATASCLFRAKALNYFPDKMAEFPMGDWPLWIWLSMQGDIFYDSSPMGVYRIHPDSTWSSRRGSLKNLAILKMLCGISSFLPSESQATSISGLVKFYYPIFRSAFFHGQSGIIEPAHEAIQKCCWNQNLICKKISEKLIAMDEIGTSASGFRTTGDCHSFYSYINKIIQNDGYNAPCLRKRFAESLVKQVLELKAKHPFRAVGTLFFAIQFSSIACFSYLTQVITKKICK
jgi:hypothetical protein